MASTPGVPAEAFRGWPAEAVTVYAGLEADGTKAWEAHRATDDTAVEAPFAALPEEVADGSRPTRSADAHPRRPRPGRKRPVLAAQRR